MIRAISKMAVLVFSDRSFRIFFDTAYGDGCIDGFHLFGFHSKT
jgi:hypothetical protein